MTLEQRRSKWKEQGRVALRPPALDEADLEPAGGGPQRQAQRRRRRILGGGERAHHEEQGFSALRGQVQPAQAVAAVNNEKKRHRLKKTFTKIIKKSLALTIISLLHSHSTKFNSGR
jgi:hypothetical protein